MANLISDDEFAEIRSVAKDLTDTFAQLDATYHKVSRKKDILHEKRSDKFDESDVAIKVLEVWESTGEKAQQRTPSKSGRIALDEGYCLVNYEDMVTAGLALNNQWTGDQVNDKITISGTKYDIIGINPIGQLKDQMVLFKIHIKKRIEKFA